MRGPGTPCAERAAHPIYLLLRAALFREGALDQ